MATITGRTETVQSGDVKLFYRQFGTPGGAPLVMLHGANYYDSWDWIETAEVLGRDREVVAFDARGYGESGWSANKDYSHNAQIGDVKALIDHLGWPKAVFAGASRGGAYAVLSGSRFAERAAGVIMIDYQPRIGIGHPGAPLVTTQTIGRKPRVFPSMRDVLAATSRDQDAPEGSPAWDRVQMFVEEVADGFFIARRDPDSANPVPLTPGDWTTDVAVDVDMWAEIAGLAVPALAIRATKSDDGLAVADIPRVEAEMPHVDIVEIDSGHDIANEAPDALIEAINEFLSGRVGG